MSNINTNELDGTYPAPGRDNDSAGLRRNFTNIKNNLEISRREISELQQKAVLKSEIAGFALDNNLNNRIIRNVQLNDAKTSVAAKGIVDVLAVLDFVEGHYQTLTTGGPVAINFINWPTPGMYGALKVEINVAGENHQIVLPESVSVGRDRIANLDTSTGILSLPYVELPENATEDEFLYPNRYIFEFSTHDGGQTIHISDLSQRHLAELPADIINSIEQKADAAFVQEQLDLKANADATMAALNTKADAQATITAINNAVVASGVPDYGMIPYYLSRVGPAPASWFYVPIPQQISSGAIRFPIAKGPWEFRMLSTLSSFNGVGTPIPYLWDILSYEEVPTKKSASATDPKLKFILDKFSENYYRSTFGPSGFNKTRADFIMMLFTKSSTIAPKAVFQKSGALPRWEVNTQTSLSTTSPTISNTSFDFTYNTADVALIVISSTDGWNSVTSLDLSNMGLVYLIFEPKYFPNLTDINLSANSIDYISGFLQDLTIASTTTVAGRKINVSGPNMPQFTVSDIAQYVDPLRARGWEVTLTNDLGNNVVLPPTT